MLSFNFHFILKPKISHFVLYRIYMFKRITAKQTTYLLSNPKSTNKKVKCKRIDPLSRYQISILFVVSSLTMSWNINILLTVCLKDKYFSVFVNSIIRIAVVRKHVFYNKEFNNKQRLTSYIFNLTV